MEFNYFDLVASVIILFLGLKGVMNGFFKELFGLVGIIGGIFLASRIGDSVGQKLSDLIFNFQNEAGINFSGFLITLTTFWMLMLMVGYVFKKLSSLSGLGIIDKILGFVFGASKFFLIASIIAYDLSTRKKIDGMDIKDHLKTRAEIPERSFFYYSLHGKIEGMRKGPWKYLKRKDEIFLFNLEEDISERYNLADKYPEKVIELSGETKAFDDQMNKEMRPYELADD